MIVVNQPCPAPIMWRQDLLVFCAFVGAVTLLAAVAYLLWGCLIYTARLLIVIENAHYRGVARVRAYEARQRATVDS